MCVCVRKREREREHSAEGRFLQVICQGISKEACERKDIPKVLAEDPGESSAIR